MSVTSSRPWPTLTMVFGLALILAGCDQPTGSNRKLKAKPAPEVVEEVPPAAPKVAPREILGKTTQDIRDMEKEKQAGGVSKQPRIVAKDPILLTGNAYVSIVSQSAQLQITHALDLYQADTGAYPKDLEEFMEKIVKPNGIKLPTLPFYQEYAYDAPNHKLVIMEYPARKEAADYPK